MTIMPNHALNRMREGGLALGLGLGHLRTVAAPLLAQAADFDFLFIDMEHGAFSIHEATQICLASLMTRVTPIVRVCKDALDEGTRALDNGAQGVVVPHVSTAEQAQRVADAFRYPPMGHRSWGGPPALFGYLPPAVSAAQTEINREILVVVMIETPEAVENAEAIAAVEGIDVLLFGTSDLTTEMGIPGQIGDQRVVAAYTKVGEACRRHRKFMGMGGVYDERAATQYIKLGARFVLGASDHQLLLSGATARAAFLRALE
jgi:2-keto-3-deoxy-L-rhamnonate aldolase RhmA